MTLAFGKQILAMPGPTNVPDEVLQAMHRPAVDIYGGDLIAITDQIRADLKTVFRTKGETFIYIANGHGGWEAALANTLSRGEKVLVLGAGRFAELWGVMAQEMGLEVEILAPPERRAVDCDAVETRLRADHKGEIKALLVVQIDTASGAVNDIPAIRAAIDAAGHDALFMVDGVASVGCMPFDMDGWNVDVTLTGSQKGLMTPPGLALMGVNEKAFARSKTADLRTRYWDWEYRLGEEHYQKYCGTPPEHMMFALSRALEMLLREEGLEASWTRHRALAEAARAAMRVWGEKGAVEFNIAEPSERCDTVTPLRVAAGFDAAELGRLAQTGCGVTLGSPIGDFKGPGGAFRFAHMGHVNAPMLMGTLGSVEAVMRALDWPLGDGALQAAAARLAETLKEAG